MKQLLTLLIAFAFYSCKDSFNPKKYQGSWIAFDEEGAYSNRYTISFEGNSILFTDLYSYTKQGIYQIESNKITIKLRDETFEKPFYFRKKDSSFLIESKRYRLITGWPKDTLERYQLVDVSTQYKISGDSLAKFDSGFHLFRDSTDSLRIKLNDKYGYYDQIPHFVFRTDSFRYPTNVIYVGKKIKLNDLVKCYYQLALVNHRQVLLVTDVSIIKNEYSTINESIEIWDEDLYEEFENIEPPNGFENDNKYNFLKKYRPQTIQIHSKEDFYKLNDIQSTKNYIIAIDQSLELKEYFELKRQILQIKRETNNAIRTEFILHQ
jgi:hypothetical protein